MKKNILIILTIFIIILLVVIKLLSGEITISSFSKINYKDTYNQKDEVYLVYFWQEDCESCEEIESDVLNYYKSTKIPIYVVDMKEENNISIWYDWENHHIENDKVIGKVINNQFVFNDDENREHYINDSEIDWEISIENNEILAIHNTPLLTREPKTINDIEIAGTPTMIRVKNGKFDKYAFNVEDVKELLK